jgi:hypothetical protein
MNARTAFFLALLSASNLLGSDLIKKSPANGPLVSHGDGPMFYIDYSNFQGLDGQTFMEFYIQVGYQELQFIKHHGHFRAGYDITFSVVTANDSAVEEYRNTDIIDVGTYTETQSAQKARASLLGFLLKPGAYKIKAHVTDIETRHTSEIVETIYPRSYQSSELMISDIQVSQKIEPAQNGQPYVKNQRYIEPNAGRIFAHGLAENIFIYFEIYNLNYFENCGSTYTTWISFYDAEGKPVAQLLRKTEKPGTTSAHSMKFPLEQFKNGEYTMTVRVQDDATGKTCESSKSYLVLDPSVSFGFVPEKWLN